MRGWAVQVTHAQLEAMMCDLRGLPASLSAAQRIVDHAGSASAMPLWKGQPYAPSQLSLGLQNDVPVLLIRFTGEVFQYYECVPWPPVHLYASHKP